MSEQWITLEIEVSHKAEDSVTSFISDIIPEGCLIQDSSLGRVKIVTYLKNDDWTLCHEKIEHFLMDLRGFFPDIPEPEITTSALKYENWATAWQDKFKPLRVGSRLIIAPPWDRPKRLGGRVPIIIEPAEAFGTGTHETTQGCLVLMEQALDKIVSDSRGCSLFDIGCGSGIISIAAYKLGACPVTAIDNDPKAVESAKQNSLLNDVGEAIEIKITNLDSINGIADVVVANLDFLTLTKYAEKISKMFQECLIVSGVTQKNWSELKERFQEAGLHCLTEIVGREWGAGLFVHNFSDEQRSGLRNIS